MTLIQEGADNIPQQAFVQWNDPQGNKLLALNRDGTIFCQGVGFAQGGALLVGPIPIVQASDTQIDSIAPTMLVENLPVTTLYQITFYYGPSGVTGSGTWGPSIAWTDPTGNSLVLGGSDLNPTTAGDPNNLWSYSIPFLCKAGTNITVTGSYSGTPFPLNIALRVVAMP